MSQQLPSVASVLADPSASDWLKSALRAALARDPVDAANDADFLAAWLARKADEVLANLARPAPGRRCGPGAE